MHFLRDIAQQNYSKYNIELPTNMQKGLTLSVSSPQSVGLAVARFYNTLDKNFAFDTESRITLPTWDSISKGMYCNLRYFSIRKIFKKMFILDLTISATVACGKNGEIGLLGVDIYFSNIAEDVTYCSNDEDHTYGFILTDQGLAVAHPSYPRPLASNKQPIFVDIDYLEKFDNFSDVRRRILLEREGSSVLKNQNSISVSI